MPHATDDLDDELIAAAISGGGPLGNPLESLGDFTERDLELGEKASDAEDFEDLADDDLADDEDELQANRQPDTDGDLNLFEELEAANKNHAGVAGGDEDADVDFDDLFNEQPRPSLTGEDAQVKNEEVRGGELHQPKETSPSSSADDPFSSPDGPQPRQSQTPFDDTQDTELSEEDEETREQRALFERARQEYERSMQGVGGEEPPPAPETNDELFNVIFPAFEAHKPLRFSRLLPYKRAQYIGRRPQKLPKPVQPSKVTLELEPDQEKAFRLPGPAIVPFARRQAESEAKGVVLTQDQDESRDESDDDLLFDSEDEKGSIGGVCWNDFVAICEDWDIASGASQTDDEMQHEVFDTLGDGSLFGQDETNDFGREASPSKRRKTSKDNFIAFDVVNQVPFDLDDPEAATAKIARRVQLDMNDPYLLIDTSISNARPKKVKTPRNIRRDATGGLTRDMNRRYNISNDEAYELLKENHQSKTRSTLGNLTTEHSIPAKRLQYPFYKVELDKHERRHAHRPHLDSEPGIKYFSKSRFVKRKHLKGKDTQDLFQNSVDLSQADNSNVLLLEYSEEYPAMLSAFGMGNRLINYYRRKDDGDNSRPKMDIGDTNVLLPQDKSPFSIFGDVEPGEIMPTLHNSMYRAPVFKHESNPQDFLLVSSKTGVHGRHWHLKNLENLHVVGQEFPSVEVPGTHSRKVTDAAKKRLKMISFRLYNKHPNRGITNDQVVAHFPGTDIPQNRAKMREFMNYDKHRGVWVPKPEEPVPDEQTIQTLLSPEEICVLDSMQVGEQQLADVGYTKNNAEVDEVEDDDEDGNQNIDQQLAPWATTKNFLNACQGKAMLKLHGEGDPSGRGEAFNLIRTSMKGGFKEIGESIESRLDAKRNKELGGHSYNVARQNAAYNAAIKKIWNAQKTSLSSTIEHDDADVDGQDETDVDRARTPTSSFQKSLRRDDETGSIYSRASQKSDTGKVLRITRRTVDKYGNEHEDQVVLRDPTVIREYMRRRRQKEIEGLSLAELQPTGDALQDAERMKVLQDHLERAKKSKARKDARIKSRNISSTFTGAGSPDSTGAVGSPIDGDALGSSPGQDGTVPKSVKRKTVPGGTVRKCANCGQVGHIKTNKKLCPLLNGQIKTSDSTNMGFGDSGFGGSSALPPLPPPAAASPS